MKFKKSDTRGQGDCYQTRWPKRGARAQFPSQVQRQTAILASVFQLAASMKRQEFEGIVASFYAAVWMEPKSEHFSL